MQKKLAALLISLVIAVNVYLGMRYGVFYIVSITSPTTEWYDFIFGLLACDYLRRLYIFVEEKLL